MPPTEELHAGELVVRRYRLADAAALHEAIVESVEHLRPFMAWIAQEPLAVEDRARLIEQWDESWAGGNDFPFGMFVGDTVVGGCGLHRRGREDGLEIGYWVRAGYTGRGFATAAARALTEAALAMPGITHVEIHHDNANVASRRVPEKLGFVRVREFEHEVTAPGETGTRTAWRMSRR